MRSLYVHVPFCKEICSYCDFCKVYYRSQWVDAYLDQLQNELFQKAVPHSLYTVYIGGGTPSSLSTVQLKRLMDLLKPYIQDAQEYTIELNPETMNEEKLHILYDGGITRLSIGVQTFQEKCLIPLHRQHRNEDVFSLIQQAKAIGFSNISIDLMYGIPYQTLLDIKKDLEILNTLDIQHLSYYALILEEHTKLYMQNYQPIDEEMEIAADQMIKETLKDMSFNQYEVSNYAKKGYESLHNQVYWQYGNYDGIGLGAHGIVDGIRYENTRSLTDYLKGHFLLQKETISQKEQMFEMVMMGLRLIQGVSSDAFYQRFHENLFEIYKHPIKKYMTLGMLENEHGYLKTTAKGMALLNEILIDFLD